MNQYVTGAVIKQLREKMHITQLELAERLSVSDKTVSKWETGRGYPDITLLESIAKVLNVSITELISGNTVSNGNTSANLLKTNFYVCPVCGNIIYSVGEATVSCHGITLCPLECEQDDEQIINVEKTDGEYLVNINHEMEKLHYISFVAAVSTDRIQMTKMYPQQDAITHFKIDGVKYIYCYCNKDGLYRKKIN